MYAQNNIYCLNINFCNIYDISMRIRLSAPNFMDNINAILQKYANKGAAVPRTHTSSAQQKPSVVRYEAQTERLESQANAVDK